jgi:hypothetical protein
VRAGSIPARGTVLLVCELPQFPGWRVPRTVVSLTAYSLCPLVCGRIPGALSAQPMKVTPWILPSVIL